MVSSSWMVAQSSRRLLAAVGLCLALFVSLSPAKSTQAALSGCRSDPVIVVNTAVIDVVSTLATTAGAVRELDYVVTVPTGSLLGSVTLTVGLGFPERVSYVFSSAQKWGTLTVAATVVTQAGVTPFSTSVQVSSLLVPTSSASGLSNGTVVVPARAVMVL
jgi:hypothetical protein